jgi:hypothetical protein
MVNHDPTGTVEQVNVAQEKANIAFNVHIDQDGVVDDEDLFDSPELLSLEIVRMRAKARRKLAWTAMITMILATAALFSPLMDNQRVSALDDLIGLFYIAQASIVGAYMGVEAWMSKR